MGVICLCVIWLDYMAEARGDSAGNG
jgi:hypothetical protein